MSCKKCKYAKWRLTEKGNIRTSRAGICTYVAKLPKLPSSVVENYLFNVNVLNQKSAIWLEDGVGCEVFEVDE